MLWTEKQESHYLRLRFRFYSHTSFSSVEFICAATIGATEMAQYLDPTRPRVRWLRWRCGSQLDGSELAESVLPYAVELAKVLVM
jgi:hypothetical protein